MFQKLWIWLFCILLITGCTQTTLNTMPAGTTPGTGQLRGQLLTTNGQTLGNRTVRLAMVYGEGAQLAYVADESGGLGGVTDARGAFAIADIPPGRYVLLVVLREGISIALLQPNGSEKIITIRADAQEDLGTVKIRLPE